MLVKSTEASTMLPAVMVKGFFVILTGTSILCCLVFSGYFQDATVELGPDHYAERLHPVLVKVLPAWLDMPLNTAVNIGYVIVGAAWCACTSVALMRGQLKDDDAKMFYVFNILSCFYGPIQMLRILTQVHGFGVLDQWITFPFFMWTFLWGLHICFGWSTLRNVLMTSVSISSYASVLIHPLGFEICLGIHIALAVSGALIAWNANKQAKCLKHFLLAILSCLGFVLIKLMDLHLPQYSRLFVYVSGHFLSKICDIFQIHFVNHFFLEITLSQYAKVQKKSE
ncbi:transmembrane protein 187-like [Dreissena polymorpha]|uniref:Transmembrane protein 187 n=1 Tax=Dreissena polymorpha TaxID=45954 RepID=A0A9D4EDK0_DREPO|nr:transmembrane protein 187-like [Dreissena polymorpha]XP_052234231.1 transmembrane protein 187-like [Dreissena polymorpha]KAH3777766.1 hypothetical protein DPMN_179214 [Dreissena polymorpha]